MKYTLGKCYLHFTDEKSEAKISQMTCTQWKAELGFHFKYVVIKNPYVTYFCYIPISSTFHLAIKDFGTWERGLLKHTVDKQITKA